MNLDYWQELIKDIAGQEEVINYYMKKRNNLILEAKEANVEVDDIIL